MSSTDDERREKATQLAVTFAAACTSIGEPINSSDALDFIGRLADITPPEYPTNFELVMIREGGRDGGESVKPGNMVLNIRNLITAIAGGALTAVGVIQVPWTAVFGALVLWGSLHAALSEPLSERDASVLWALWLRSDSERTIPEAGLLEAVNDERAKYGRNNITDKELNDALGRLLRIRSIKRSSQNQSRWWVREWVRVAYE